MPYKRFSDLNEGKKSLILKTALNIFSENSFEVASINMISKEAKLSAGALYYYFENKKDLFNTTLDYMSREFLQDVGVLNVFFEKNGYWQGIKMLVHKRLELGIKNPDYMRLFQRILLSKDINEIDVREKTLLSFKEIFNYGFDRVFFVKICPKTFYTTCI